MQLAAQKVAANMLRPIIVDVYAKLVDGVVDFDHEWKFQGDPGTKKGRIDVPAGGKGTPPATMHFHLHDSTGLHLKFVSPTSEAMWVSLTDTCPDKAGNGGQISYNHPWTANVLMVDDANSGAPCTLYYTLRFDGDAYTDPAGKQHPPYEYDPEIRNGGGTIPIIGASISPAVVAAGVAAAVLAIAYFLWFR